MNPYEHLTPYDVMWEEIQEHIVPMSPLTGRKLQLATDRVQRLLASRTNGQTAKPGCYDVDSVLGDELHHQTAKMLGLEFA